MPELLDDYSDASDALRQKHRDFDDFEAMFLAEVTTGQQHDFKTRLTDAALSTIVIERSARVMSQFPKGSVKALSRADKGKALLMGLLMDRYIVPNSNWVYPHLQKLQLWDLYSLVYGSMFVMTDWRVDKNYVGPDFTLIPIRNVTPQKGKVTIDDSDYIYIDSYHSPKWFEEQMKETGNGWKKKNLKEFLDKKKDESSKKEKASFAEERARYMETKDRRVVTKYTRDKWITFDPKSGKKLREMDNPHDNGEIPVIGKRAFPLIDDFFGIGDMKRGEGVQKAMDTITGLTMDGVKMDVFPPRIVNPHGVVQSSLGWGPGETWLETLPNSIRFSERSAKNLNTFQTLITYLRGTLLNQNGTTNTAINQEGAFDPGFGKTPQALQMLQQRENTRDNWDRTQMEMAVEKLYNRMIDLMLQRQKKPIEIHLFDEEIEQIKNSGYEDVTDLIEESQSGDMATVTIGSEDIEGVNYRFYIDSQSTAQRDRALEHEVYGEMLQAFSKLPGLQESLKQQGFEFNFGELLRKWASTAGVDDFDSIISPISQSDTVEQPEQGDPNNPAGMNGANQQAIEQQLMQQQMAQQNPQLGAQTANLDRQQAIDPELIRLAQQQLGG